MTQAVEKGVPQGRRPWLGPRGPAAAGFLRLNCSLTRPHRRIASRSAIHAPGSPCGRPKLPGQDSNLDKENQNLLCYRYTTGY